MDKNTIFKDIVIKLKNIVDNINNISINSVSSEINKIIDLINKKVINQNEDDSLTLSQAPAPLIIGNKVETLTFDYGVYKGETKMVFLKEEEK